MILIEAEAIMIRHGIGLALGLVLLAGSASRAGELDTEFGPKSRTTSAAVAPERPDLATLAVADHSANAPPKALSRELIRQGISSNLG